MQKEDAIKNIQETLKTLLSFSKKVEKVEVKFADVKTTDGQILNVEGEDVAVKAPIFIKDDKGANTPVEDGSYTLEDGRTIEVLDGVVETVSNGAKEGEEESPVADANTEEMAAEEAPVEEAVEEAPEGGDMETRVAELEGQITQILEILQGLSSSQEQAMSRINEFGALPAEDSIKETKVKATVFEKSRMTYSKNKSEIEALREIMKKNDNSNYGTFQVGN